MTRHRILSLTIGLATLFAGTGWRRPPTATSLYGKQPSFQLPLLPPSSDKTPHPQPFN